MKIIVDSFDSEQINSGAAASSAACSRSQKAAIATPSPASVRRSRRLAASAVSGIPGGEAWGASSATASSASRL